MSEQIEWLPGGISGMCDFEPLYDRVVAEAPPNSLLVEVGIFFGRSLVYLAKAAKRADKGLQVVGVDWGKGFGTTGLTANEVLGNIVYRNLDVPLIFCDSAKAAMFFPPQSCHFVFIDADHSREGITKDINAWYPRVAPDGILAGHDYAKGEIEVEGFVGYPDVKAVVDSYFENAQSKTCPSCWEVRVR
jgi:predicted O-methyltransferase YrrM